jgi:hypothetical protein
MGGYKKLRTYSSGPRNMLEKLPLGHNEYVPSLASGHRYLIANYSTRIRLLYLVCYSRVKLFKLRTEEVEIAEEISFILSLLN